MHTIAGVVGVAIGAVDGQPVIKLLVVQKTPELEQKIPKMVEGYPVVLEETGEIRADRKCKRHFAPAFTSAPCADTRRENLRIVTNRANPHNTVFSR
jgi:hypothetical protein